MMLAMTYTDERRRFDTTTRFTLTDEHLILLRAAYVQWQDCETGAPEIDPKRPYGNSDVPFDVAELLIDPEILEVMLNEDDQLPESEEGALLLRHRETELALQVVLQTQSFTPGNYVRDSLYQPWRPA
jgi:hypothetical protein